VTPSPSPPSRGSSLSTKLRQPPAAHQLVEIEQGGSKSHNSSPACSLEATLTPDVYNSDSPGATIAASKPTVPFTWLLHLSGFAVSVARPHRNTPLLPRRAAYVVRLLLTPPTSLNHDTNHDISSSSSSRQNKTSPAPRLPSTTHHLRVIARYREGSLGRPDNLGSSR
jgi:hypothetical protein